MIAWTKDFPLLERPLGYIRLMRARQRFFDYLSIRGKSFWAIEFYKESGYQAQIAQLRNRHKGRPGFVIGNGPSLQTMDLSPLRNEVTIGCNGIYKEFEKWGFYTRYFMFEDVEQCEIRRKDLATLQGPLKLYSIYNAYCIKPDEDTLFFNAPRFSSSRYYWEDVYPQFSRDFASIAHLGSSITYLMIQWAYYLGCDPIYIIGVDHNYGKLVELYPPGKIKITAENIDEVRRCHFSSKYYQIGDVMGVPFVARQNKAFDKSREVIESEGRRIFNAGLDSKLESFERVDFDSIFSKK